MSDTLTREKLLDAIKQIEGAALPRSSIWDQPFKPFGFNIIEAPVRVSPRVKLNDEFKWCSDKFRDEYNAWLVEMFGCYEQCPVKPGEVLVFNNMAVMRPECAAVIRNTTA